MSRVVREERTGWRDESLSQRHRRWGWDCPAVDLDFVSLEYDKGKASVLVEYKNEHAAPQMASHPSYRAMVDLVRPGIPVFAVRYASDFSWWRAVPLNREAKRWLPTRTELTEREWVALLYEIRGTPMPSDLLEQAEVEI
jgi:hypothetical protein